MRFAVTIPNFGPFADVRKLAEIAKEAEANGWHGFFLWDHIHWTWAPEQQVLDPWVALAAVAVSTERIRIGTMVTPVPRRRPWKLARETVTLDHLSGGRLILGVGLGYPPEEEFSRLGEEPDDRARARRLDEGLAVLAGLWSGEPFSFDGEIYHVENVQFLPKPHQQPRIPIWVAGMWPARAPFRRAARWDGVVPMKVDLSTGELQLLETDDIEKIVAYVRRHRKGQEPFDVVVGGLTPLDDPARARDIVSTYEAAGVTWLLSFEPDPEALIARVRQGPPEG